MSINTIVTTSGFIIPDNEYFIPVYPNNTESLNKLKSITKKDKLSLLNTTDKIYFSQECNLAYTRYLENPSCENMLSMVLLVCDIVKDIDVHRFFYLQSSCKYLSPVSFQFCRDVINQSFLRDFRKYNVVPCTIRSDFSSFLTTSDLKERASILHKETNISREWPLFLPSIIENKEAFITFFKYIFVDSY